LSWERKKKDCGTGVLGFGNVVGVFWGVFGTHLEHVWNKRGTSLEQFILILRELQGFVERAWNMRGTWWGFGGFFLLVHENMNAGKT